MSLPSLHLVCDVCGDSAKLGPFPRAFYLTEKDGPLPLRWTTGWCADCGQSRRLEDWPHAAALLREGAELVADDVERQTRQREAAPAPRQRGWLAQLFNRGPETPAPSPMDMSRHAQELADLQLFHRLLNQRQSTNRCMDCGSTHVWHWDLDKEPAPEHPGCGGHFRASDESSGLRLSYWGMAVLYDLEGKSLGTLQTNSRDGRPTAEELVADMQARPEDFWKHRKENSAAAAVADRQNNAREERSDGSLPPETLPDPKAVRPSPPSWPRLSDFPQTETGFNRYMNSWVARRRAARVLSQIPMWAVEEHRAAVALAKEMGWEEREEE